MNTNPKVIGHYWLQTVLLLNCSLCVPSLCVALIFTKIVMEEVCCLSEALAFMLGKHYIVQINVDNGHTGYLICSKYSWFVVKQYLNCYKNYITPQISSANRLGLSEVATVTRTVAVMARCCNNLTQEQLWCSHFWVPDRYWFAWLPINTRFVSVLVFLMSLL